MDIATGKKQISSKQVSFIYKALSVKQPSSLFLSTYSKEGTVCEGMLCIVVSQLVFKTVKIVQVITVVSSLWSYKDIMMIQDFKEWKYIICIIISCSKQVIHLILCNILIWWDNPRQDLIPVENSISIYIMIIVKLVFLC